MVKNIIHNPVFRVFTPIFYGLTMYILILLIFDSIQQLSENFFSTEVFLSVILTCVIFELLRLYAIYVEKFCPQNCKNVYRLVIQFFGAVVISLCTTSIIISLYFSKLVGFNSYNTELIVFNTIFVLTGILYNMIYFSFFYLNRMNVAQLDQESLLRKNTETELNTFKNKINPEFLYSSLESLISLSKKSPEEADQFILKVSDVYRNILSAKNNELTLLKEEFKISKALIEIMNYKLNGNLKFCINKFIDNNSNYIISGTMVVIIEDIVNRSVISNIQPLEISGKLDGGNLKIYHPVQNKLIQGISKNIELKHLYRAYKQYDTKKFSIYENNNNRIYSFPVLEPEK